MLTSAVVLGTALSVALPAAPAAAFDPDTGGAIFEVVGGRIVPPIYDLSNNGCDASIVLRITSSYATGWFDSTAPFTDHAVGIYSHIPRRPAAERTLRNQNVALLYATLVVARELFPQDETEWSDMMLDAGLDPDDDSTDLTTAVGVGNVAGAAVIEARLNDGDNQRGDGNGRVGTLVPFEDTTGYRPKNTAYELEDPSHWQPLMKTQKMGLFTIQQFVTPQFGRVRGYTVDGAHDDFTIPGPTASDYQHHKAEYKAQAEAVIAEVAGLTDEGKMIAEHFNDKLVGVGGSIGFIFASRGYTQQQFIEMDVISQASAWDASIGVWNQKRRFDAVRPFSAIRFLKKGKMIPGYGGPGKGTVMMKGEEWQSYLPTADHPEYPSGSSNICAAHAEAMRMYLGSDTLNWPVTWPAGSSRFEPGITPHADITHLFSTWTQFEEECSHSRTASGVHFLASTQHRELGHVIGAQTAAFILEHINGTVDDDDDDDDCDDHGHHGHGHHHCH